MPRPRRAVHPTTPPRRVLALGIGALVALIALVGVVLAPRLRHDAATAPLPGPATSMPGSSSPSPTPSSTGPAHRKDAAAALDACRKDVAARDKVLSAAKQGVAHWTEHVDAQLDADAGKITVAQMNAVFRRTRLAGPADVKSYDKAVRAERRSRGSCGRVEGASAKVADRLAACGKRRRAQEPVLAAAKAGMTAWRLHLADMRRAASGGISDAAEHWRTTYAAAPRAIDAYERASAGFDAPTC